MSGGGRGGRGGGIPECHWAEEDEETATWDKITNKGDKPINIRIGGQMEAKIKEDTCILHGMRKESHTSLIQQERSLEFIDNDKILVSVLY